MYSRDICLLFFRLTCSSRSIIPRDTSITSVFVPLSACSHRDVARVFDVRGKQTSVQPTISSSLHTREHECVGLNDLFNIMPFYLFDGSAFSNSSFGMSHPGWFAWEDFTLKSSYSLYNTYMRSCNQWTD